jgi:CheY-like chemotaxis protein
VKFTDAGGVSVSVMPATVDANGVRVRIAVQDTGIGLSAEDMRRLFTEFEQAETAIRRRNGGTGLGLAISMQLARAMGGEISVESAPGNGSTFTATIVLGSATLSDATETFAGFDADCIGRVLLAFDRPLERAALGYALEAAGVDVVESDFSAGVGTLDRAAAEAAPFDRVVIDSAEGADAARRLLDRARELNSQRKVRGIVLVNVLARADLAEFRAAGFDAYLVRPVRPASMMLQLGWRSNGTPAYSGANSMMDCVPPASGLEQVRPRVLLAEDNEINLLLAKRVLEKCGCDYVAVTNGAEAVDVVRRMLDGEAPAVDLMLMDIFMPQLDGLEATRIIRELYAGRTGAGRIPPIVALTANAFAEDKRRYLAAGMDDYLAKPFDRAGLEAVLRRWFSRSAGDDTNAAA